MIEIRERNRSEYEEALELAFRIFLEFDVNDGTDAGIEEYRKNIHDPVYLQQLRVFTAYEAGKEVGVIATRNDGSHVAQFYVDGVHHRQGIGRQLFDHIWKINNKGYMTVNSSTYAIPVYRALGFREIDKMQESNGLKYTPMERIELYYEETGHGTPLILLHGNGEDSTYFANQIGYFSENYRTIAVDTRGHGRSPRGAADFSIRQFADDLAGFMERHEINKADILGFSDGGNIALIFAMKYSEKVDKLIVDGADLYPEGVKSFIQVPITIAYHLVKTFGLWRKSEMLGLMVNDPYIRSGELEKIRAKTLVIAGTRDMMKQEHTELIASSIPNADLAIIPGSHFVARENPTEFNDRVNRFLKGVSNGI